MMKRNPHQKSFTSNEHLDEESSIIVSEAVLSFKGVN